MSKTPVYVALIIGDIYEGVPPLFAEMAPVFAYEKSGDVVKSAVVGDTEVVTRAFSTSEVDRASSQASRIGQADLVATMVRASSPLCQSVLEFCSQGPSLLVAGQTMLFEYIVRVVTAYRLVQSDPEKKGFPVSVRFSGFYSKPGGGYTGRSAAFCGYQFDMQKSLDLLAEAVCDPGILDALRQVPLGDNLTGLAAAFSEFGLGRQDKYKPIIAVVPD